MPSISNSTGNFFSETEQGRLEDLQQSVIDRVLTRIGTRPYNEGYGSLFYLFGRINNGPLIESIERALRSDERVNTVFVDSAGQSIDIMVNQNERQGVLSQNPRPTIEGETYQGLLDIARDAFDDGFDLRALLSWENAPIWFVRDYAQTLTLVPHTSLLGEVFERRVVQNWFDFFSLRDKEAIIQLYARLAEMQYTATFERETGNLELCFTPSPFRLPPDSLFLQELRDVCRWMLPHYENRMTVVFCIFAETDLYTGGYGVQFGRKQYFSAR